MGGMFSSLNLELSLEISRMTDPNYPYFAYHTDAWSYTERA
jgi:hypothetical protein